MPIYSINDLNSFYSKADNRNSSTYYYIDKSKSLYLIILYYYGMFLNIY